MRKRVIHLVILGRFSSANEIITQIRKDSLSEEIAQEDADRVQEIIDEVICYIIVWLIYLAYLVDVSQERLFGFRSIFLERKDMEMSSSSRWLTNIFL